MSFQCQFCPQVCKNRRGLTQHVNRNQECKRKQDALLGINGGFCLPADSATATATTATAPRRSNRNSKPYTIARAPASRIGRAEVPDVELGSIESPEVEDVEPEAEEDFEAANDSDLESNDDESEAEASEVRDDITSDGEELTN